ncbi:amiloride-sensitive sodium channel subunit delta [Dermochelys coriacea]|uniref:amiloride-sensitive sodium channel subunit delta n=1 Tax=Dermochelys coriacea TaxID=27794 RepID=UPI001CA9C4C6|nr:amiloride-sensitive sodium channel subunit delta [Dermochelys coriacea]
MEQEWVNEEMGDEGLIEFYSSFKDMFEFFCKNTTIHGTVRLVCSSRNRMKTAFWTLLFLASFGMLYWQFALLFSQYWTYPVIMTMSVHSEPKMFPAITLCNLDPYRFDLVSEKLAQLDQMAEEAIANLYGYKTSSFSSHYKKGIRMKDLQKGGSVNLNSSSFQLNPHISLVMLKEPDTGSRKKHFKVGFKLCNATGGNCFYKAYSSGVDTIQEWYRFHYMNIMSQLPIIINISSHEEHIQNLVYSCQYDGEPCRKEYHPCKALKVLSKGGEGLLSLLYRGGIDYIHFHHQVYGSCYTFNSEGTDVFWKATKPGISYGLSLILKVEQNDRLPLLSTVAGVQVMIHNHNQTPFLEHEWFDIRPGIATSIGIRQDEVHRLGGNYGKCTVDGEDVDVKLLYNSSYTLQACLHSCFQHKMVERCGCGYYYYPLPPGAEYCNYNKHPAWGHCFYQLYNRLADHILSCFANVPTLLGVVVPRCLQGPQNGHQQMNLKHKNDNGGYLCACSKQQHASNIEILVAGLDPPDSESAEGYNSNNRRDIAKVNIFYQQLSYQSVDESPVYTVNLLLSNMGSQWSLWFGPRCCPW